LQETKEGFCKIENIFIWVIISQLYLLDVRSNSKLIQPCVSLVCLLSTPDQPAGPNNLISLKREIFYISFSSAL
jgi:hypothetical protein